MLKLLKRCKSLVVLPLLCGCLVSFSSVSFADVSQFSVSGWNVKEWSQGQFSDSVSASVTFTLGSNVLSSTFTEINNNMQDTRYRVVAEAPLFITLNLSNTSSTDVYIEPSAGIVVKDLAFSTTNTVTNGQLFWNLKDIRNVFGNAAITYIGGGQINFPYDPDFNYNRCLVIPANSNRIYTFECTLYATQIVDEVNFRGSFSDTQIVGFTILDYTAHPIPEGEFVNPDTVQQDTLDSIESQTQQQQQQYEDFTNDGNSPVGDGISGSDFVGGSREEVNDKLGFFEIINYTIQGILGVFNADAILTDTTITLPGFEIPIRSTDPNTGMATSTTYTVWQNTEYDLGQELNTNFGSLMTVVRFATSVVVLFGLINYIIKVYHQILGIPRG